MINCERKSPIYIQWHTEPYPKLYPHRADLTYKHDKFDYFSCKFGSDTATRLAELMDDNEDFISESGAVTVYIEDYPIRRMYYHPNRLQTGKEVKDTSYSGTLELQDLHRHLREGSVDVNFDQSATPEKVYTELFRRRNKDDLFSGITVRGVGNELEDPAVALGWGGLADVGDFDFGYALNFNSVSPLEAIKEANSKFGLDTHVSPSGELIVGGFEGNATFTANEQATADFHIESAGITQDYSESIEYLYIEGPTIHASKSNDFDTGVDNLREWISPFDDAEYSGLRLQITVRNTASKSGKYANAKAHHIEEDEALATAVRKYRAIESSNRTGTLTVNMTSSKRPAVPRIGDAIRVEQPYSCGEVQTPSYYGDLYYTTGMRHKYDSTWTTDMDLLHVPPSEDNLQIRMRYFDAGKNRSFSFEEIHGYSPQDAGLAYADLYVNESEQ